MNKEQADEVIRKSNYYDALEVDMGYDDCMVASLIDGLFYRRFQACLQNTHMLKFHNLERKMKSRYPRGLLKKINRNAVLLNELLEF